MMLASHIYSRLDAFGGRAGQELDISRRARARAAARQLQLGLGAAVNASRS